MNVLSVIVMSVLPGGWILFGMYKLYERFFMKKAYDTDYVYTMYIHKVIKDKKHRPFVGSNIYLTNDISRVIVNEDGSHERKFYE